MISVIIPVYNAEPYLPLCLESVLNSVYQDFEIILINDGSTDGSFRICEEFAERDQRIRLFSQERKGVSAARNRGIELCSGEWVVFIDADDIISADFLGLIAREEHQSQDLLLFDFAPGPFKGTEAEFSEEQYRYGEQEILNLMERTLMPKQLRKGGTVDFLSACARAHKKSILDEYAIRFSPDLYNGEDRLFELKYLLKSKSYTYIAHPVYFYFAHSDSSSHRFNIRLLHNHTELMKKIGQLLEREHLLPQLEMEYSSCILDLLTTVLFRGIFSPSNQVDYRKKVALCNQMREFELCRKAMKYNGKCGDFRRRILIALFRRKLFFATGILCRMNHILWKLLGRC